jgi:hypothetical protein
MKEQMHLPGWESKEEEGGDRVLQRGWVLTMEEEGGNRVLQ